MGDIYVANNQRYEVGPGGLEQFLIDFPNAVLQNKNSEEIEVEEITEDVVEEKPEVEKIFFTGSDLDYINYPEFKDSNLSQGVYIKNNNKVFNLSGDVVIDIEQQKQQYTIDGEKKGPGTTHRIIVDNENPDPFGLNLKEGIYVKKGTDIYDRAGNIVNTISPNQATQFETDHLTEKHQIDISKPKTEAQIYDEKQHDLWLKKLRSGEIEESNAQIFDYTGDPADPMLVKYPSLRDKLTPGDRYYKYGEFIYDNPGAIGEESQAIAQLDFTYATNPNHDIPLLNQISKNADALIAVMEQKTSAFLTGEDVVMSSDDLMMQYRTLYDKLVTEDVFLNKELPEKLLQESEVEIKNYLLELSKQYDLSTTNGYESALAAYEKELDRIYLEKVMGNEEFLNRLDHIAVVVDNKFSEKYNQTLTAEERSELMQSTKFGSWAEGKPFFEQMWTFPNIIIPNAVEGRQQTNATAYYQSLIDIKNKILDDDYQWDQERGSGYNIKNTPEGLTLFMNSGMYNAEKEYDPASGLLGFHLFSDYQNLHISDSKYSDARYQETYSKEEWLEIIDKELAKISKYSIGNYIASKEYQRSLELIGSPTVLSDKPGEIFDFSGDEFKGVLGLQFMQMLAGALTFGGSTFVQESSGVLWEEVAIEAARKYSPDKSTEIALQEFNMLPPEVQGEYMIACMDEGLIDVDGAIRLGMVNAGLDLVGNIVTILSFGAGAGVGLGIKSLKLAPKKIFFDLMEGNVRKGIGNLAKGITYATGVGVAFEMPTEMTQEFNSMLQVQLATDGKVSIASMDKKRIAEAGLQALMSTGTFIGGGKILQTGKVGVQELRTNLKAMSNEDHARNYVKKVRKEVNRQIENGNMTSEEAEIVFDELNAWESLVEDTKLKSLSMKEKVNVLDGVKKQNQTQKKINELKEKNKGVKENEWSVNDKIYFKELTQDMIDATNTILTGRSIEFYKQSGQELAKVVNQDKTGVWKDKQVQIFKTNEEVIKFLKKHKLDHLINRFRYAESNGLIAEQVKIDGQSFDVAVISEENIKNNIKEGDRAAANTVHHEVMHFMLDPLLLDETTNLVTDIIPLISKVKNPKLQLAFKAATYKFKQYEQRFVGIKNEIDKRTDLSKEQKNSLIYKHKKNLMEEFFTTLSDGMVRAEIEDIYEDTGILKSIANSIKKIASPFLYLDVKDRASLSLDNLDASNVFEFLTKYKDFNYKTGAIDFVVSDEKLKKNTFVSRLIQEGLVVLEAKESLKQRQIDNLAGPKDEFGNYTMTKEEWDAGGMNTAFNAIIEGAVLDDLITSGINFPLYGKSKETFVEDVKLGLIGTLMRFNPEEKLGEKSGLSGWINKQIAWRKGEVSNKYKTEIERKGPSLSKPSPTTGKPIEVADVGADVNFGDDITLSSILNKEDNTKLKRHELSERLIELGIITRKEGKNKIIQRVIDALLDGKLPQLKEIKKGKNFLTKAWLLDKFSKEFKQIKDGLGTGNKYKKFIDPNEPGYNSFLYDFILDDYPLVELTRSGMQAFYKLDLDENGNTQYYTVEEAELILGLPKKDNKSKTGREKYRKVTRKEFSKKDFRDWALAQGNKLHIGIKPETGKPYITPGTRSGLPGNRKTWIAARINQMVSFDAIMSVAQNVEQQVFDINGKPKLDENGKPITINVKEILSERQIAKLQGSSFVAELGAAINRNPAIKFSHKTKAEKAIANAINPLTKNEKLMFIGNNLDNIMRFSSLYNYENKTVEEAFNTVYGKTSINKYKENIVEAFETLQRAVERHVANIGKKTPMVYSDRFGPAKDTKKYRDDITTIKAFNAASQVEYISTMLDINSNDINIFKMSEDDKIVVRKEIVDLLQKYINEKGLKGDAAIKHIVNIFGRALAHGNKQQGSYFAVNKILKEQLLDVLIKNNTIKTGLSDKTHIDPNTKKETRGTSLYDKNNKPIKDEIKGQTVSDITGGKELSTTPDKKVVKQYQEQSKKAREQVYEALNVLRKIYNAENATYSDNRALAALTYSWISDMNSTFKMGGKLTGWGVNSSYSLNPKKYTFAHFPSSSFLANKAIQFVRGDITMEEFKNHYENSIVAVIPDPMDKEINKKNLNTVTKDYEINGIVDPIAILRDITMDKSKLYDVKDVNTNKTIFAAPKESKTVPLQEAVNIDKAIANAIKESKKTKGLSIFDFDDTLAKTASKVKYILPDGTVGRLTGKQWLDWKKAGAKFDFSEFSKVVEGKKGPLFELAQKRKEKFGNKNIFVLTARPKAAAVPIYEFLKEIGLEIPLENITALENSSAKAKADWVVEKAAEGYNDFYFADDAIKNVKAVKNVLDVVDVKSKVQLVIKESKKSLNKEFNEILENKTGIPWRKRFSASKARTVGASKGGGNFFIPYSAEDFMGLLYPTLSKGNLGDTQMAWYKENILRPFSRAMTALDNERITLMADYNGLKKKLKNIPKNLKKEAIKGEGYTVDHAIRVYIWNKQDMKVPDISKGDEKMLVDHVKKNPELKEFAEQLIKINKSDGYVKPDNNWAVGTITTDLLSGLNTIKRAKHLENSGYTENINEIFSKTNLNKLEAIYGRSHREALEDSLRRMKTGRNQKNISNNPQVKAITDWLNEAVGSVMFFNTRSAVLQTISAINFVNWSDNNMFAAGKAFANQKQFWKDFMYIMNSDFLVARRQGLRINVSESDIADAAATSTNKYKAAVSYLLKKGFLPTQIMDSFAIAAGGSTFYRNRVNTYVKQGLSKKEAEIKAFNDFRDIAEVSQQSSRPDLISQQQASPIGRIILAFANTPSQYARLTKKAFLDLKNGRGDWKTNVSKIVYYMALQNLLFNALQQALFAVAFSEEEEDDDKKQKRYVNIGNGMLDSILRGLGYAGVAVSTIKNMLLKLSRESEKKRPRYSDVALEILNFSPPIDSKISKLRSAGRTIEYSDEGFGPNMDSMEATSLIIESLTNIPTNRVFRKAENISAATKEDKEIWERIALLLGWSEWQLEIKGKDSSKTKETKESKKVKIEKELSVIEKHSREFIDANRDSLAIIVKREKQLIDLNKDQQTQILLDFGLSKKQIRDLNYEQNRVNKIIELEFNKKKKNK